MKRRYLRCSRIVSLVLCMGVLFACTGCSTTQTPANSTSAQPPPSTAAASESTASVAAPVPRPDYSPFVVPYFPPPPKMDLCGDPVPLHIQEVAERFDKEFTLVVYNHAQVYLWLKRMERYFPWIEERLRYHKLPDDLKYVAIVESDLLPNACSPKGAAGPWQFMPKTGCSYGLDVQECYDERFDFERATDCAFRYLGDLYKRYKNWALAIACYNCGDKRILDQMKAQGTKDYYHMKLPVETERYVFRILAIKAVLNNAAQYGYHLPKGQGYPELKADKATVTLSKTTSIHTLAAAAGTTYREFKRMNPTFRSDDIAPGTYEVKLPKGMGEDFRKNFNGAKALSPGDDVRAAAERTRSYEPQPEASSPQGSTAEARPVESPAKSTAKPAEKTVEATSTAYTVQKGDTLSAIAVKTKVSVDQLKKMNNLKGNDIVPGQTLRLR